MTAPANPPIKSHTDTTDPPPAAELRPVPRPWARRRASPKASPLPFSLTSRSATGGTPLGG